MSRGRRQNVKNLKSRLDNLEKRAAAAGEEDVSYISFADAREYQETIKESKDDTEVARSGRPIKVKAYITVSPDDWDSKEEVKYFSKNNSPGLEAKRGK